MISPTYNRDGQHYDENKKVKTVFLHAVPKLHFEEKLWNLCPPPVIILNAKPAEYINGQTP
jgi:hypothetical protein